MVAPCKVERVASCSAAAPGAVRVKGEGQGVSGVVLPPPASPAIGVEGQAVPPVAAQGRAQGRAGQGDSATWAVLTCTDSATSTMRTSGQASGGAVRVDEEEATMFANGVNEDTALLWGGHGALGEAAGAQQVALGAARACYGGTLTNDGADVFANAHSRCARRCGPGHGQAAGVAKSSADAAAVTTRPSCKGVHPDQG